MVYQCNMGIQPGCKKHLHIKLEVMPGEQPAAKRAVITGNYMQNTLLTTAKLFLHPG